MAEEIVGGPIIEVSDSTFEEAVLKSSVPVIVDFWAPWCAPCRMVAPILEEIAKDYVGQVVVAKINTDENPTRAVQYGVRGIPTLLFIKAGQEVDRQVGAVPKRVITDKLSVMLA